LTMRLWLCDFCQKVGDVFPTSRKKSVFKKPLTFFSAVVILFLAQRKLIIKWRKTNN